MKDHGLRFAIYARVSTEAQEDEGQSLSTQVSMMRDVILRMGAVVAEVYQVQESAMPDRDRPSLTRLLKDAAAGHFDAVIVCKMDRLSRSIAVLTHVEKNLRDFGIQLFEGEEEHNLRSAEGTLTRGMHALIGEYSVRRLKWSACASRLERARRGWPHSAMVPFGRKVLAAKDRRNTDAVWLLDEPKAALASEMYRLYIDECLTLVQVGKRVGMQPETVRRVMMEQGGPVWIRHFIDPSTGQKVEVRTAIPALFTDSQIIRLQDRAKQNQAERASWANRRREYPLSRYLRCSNPNCSWSNLSGHQSTFERLTKGSKRPSSVTAYSYYLHLPRKRTDDGCFHSVPAELIEDEIFSRLGQFLKHSDQLTAAIRAALITDPVETQRLKAEQSTLVSSMKNARRVLANALEILFEQKGTSAGALAQAKVDEQNLLIATLEERLNEVRTALKVTDLPKDFPERFARTMFRLVGLNGHIPMHWPVKAKKALLSLFFGGSKSTRFDRDGKHQHSNRRGIFLTRVTPDDGEPYWRYEAKGSIGDFAGALTRVVETYENETSETPFRRFEAAEIKELGTLATTFEGLTRFRSSPDASRRWSASACRGTFHPS
jgi:DNA invertase Pin-like site-specific DNA recombinase